MFYVLLALAVFAGLLAVYALFKVIWYTVKMLAFRFKLGRLKAQGLALEFKRPFYKMIFGKKGETHFIVSNKRERYAVSVISFVSTRGRWNIEQAQDGYYVEVRRYNRIFFNLYVNTGTEPEYSKDYRRESRLIRSRLHLSPEETSGGKRVLLIHPRPKLLTYTDTRFRYLGAGDSVSGYQILYAPDLFEALK